MKKILIITYCYPPCNAISSHRPKSFADNFAQYCLYPIVVTRHWKGDEKTWLDFQRPDLRPPEITVGADATVIRLPYSGRRQRAFDRIAKWKLVRKAAAFFLSLTGTFQIHNDAIDSFEDYLNEYLTKNKVDYIFATVDPLSIGKLACRLNKRFGIPIVVDFRDLWNNSILNRAYRPSINERVIDFLYEWHIARWIKPARFVTSVTEPINEEVRRISTGMSTLTITNGFETKLFQNFRDTEVAPNEKFTFSIVGTLFPEHDLSVLVEGMHRFLADKNLSTIQLNLIGTAGIPEIKDFFEKHFPPVCTRLTERIPRDEALAIMSTSDVLFHAGWRNYRGIASGKVFEYMGARRNVLIAPGDKDIMEELVTSTGVGKVANSAEEFVDVMNDWYAEWQKHGKLEWHGDVIRIMRYSRENQARLLAEAILEIG